MCVCVLGGGGIHKSTKAEDKAKKESKTKKKKVKKEKKKLEVNQTDLDNVDALEEEDEVQEGIDWDSEDEGEE